MITPTHIPLTPFAVLLVSSRDGEWWWRCSTPVWWAVCVLALIYFCASDQAIQYVKFIREANHAKRGPTRTTTTKSMPWGGCGRGGGGVQHAQENTCAEPCQRHAHLEVSEKHLRVMADTRLCREKKKDLNSKSTSTARRHINTPEKAHPGST